MKQEISILGFSEACITMITDILYTNKIFPKIKIINNLNREAEKEYLHPDFDMFFDEYNDGEYVLGVIKTKEKRKLKEVFNHLNEKLLINLISNETHLSKTIGIGKGVIINCGVTIAGHTKIKDFVFINRNVNIGHHTIIGDYTTINPGSNIAGNVIIGNDCQIGMGSTIIDGIKIGKNSIIGAGSLVTKDIPDNVVAYGSPCKIIRQNK